MAEFEFTADDLDRVAGQLDDVGEQLSDKERGILLAVFQLAADRVAAGGDIGDTDVRGGSPAEAVYRFSAGSERLPRLSEGFRGSFEPGAKRGVWAADDVSVGVTVGVMF